MNRTYQIYSPDDITTQAERSTFSLPSGAYRVFVVHQHKAHLLYRYWSIERFRARLQLGKFDKQMFKKDRYIVEPFSGLIEKALILHG